MRAFVGATFHNIPASKTSLLFESFSSGNWQIRTHAEISTLAVSARCQFAALSEDASKMGFRLMIQVWRCAKIRTERFETPACAWEVKIIPGLQLASEPASMPKVRCS